MPDAGRPARVLRDVHLYKVIATLLMLYLWSVSRHRVLAIHSRRRRPRGAG